MASSRFFGDPLQSLIRAAFAPAICFAAVSMLATTAHALIVGTTPNVLPSTMSNPLNNPTWAATGKGDPGWANEGTRRVLQTAYTSATAGYLQRRTSAR